MKSRDLYVTLAFLLSAIILAAIVFSGGCSSCCSLQETPICTPPTSADYTSFYEVASVPEPPMLGMFALTVGFVFLFRILQKQ